MSKLSKFIGMASKALEQNGRSPQGSSTDWRGMIRGAADALTGDGQRSGVSGAPGSSSPGGYTPPRRPSTTPPPAGPGHPRQGSDADRAAIARYDYLMQTADPHQIEQIHREAFARLTPQQRAQVESRMRTEFAPHERPRSSSPDDLARAAGRAEAMSPGRIRGLLGRAGGGAAAVGVGGLAVGVLGAVAGGAVVSAVAAPLLEQAAGLGVDFDALAEGVDLGALAEGAEGVTGAVGDTVSGFGEQVSGWGEQLGDFGGLGDFFGR